MLALLEWTSERLQYASSIAASTLEVAVAVLLKLFDLRAVVIVGHVLAPVVPEPFDGHAVWRIARKISKGQMRAVSLKQVSHQS